MPDSGNGQTLDKIKELRVHGSSLGASICCHGQVAPPREPNEAGAPSRAADIRRGLIPLSAQRSGRVDAFLGAPVVGAYTGAAQRAGHVVTVRDASGPSGAFNNCTHAPPWLGTTGRKHRLQSG